MIPFLLRRLLHGVMVMLGVTIIVFVVTRVIGNPVNAMLPLNATEEQRAHFSRQLGLDQPVLTQLWSFLGDLVRLDFGDSLWQGSDALTIVLQRLPYTITIVVAAVVLSLALAVVLGVVASLRPGSLVDRGLVSMSLVGLSVPQFWLALMLIIVFSVHLGWLPTSGVGGLQHLVLPVIALAAPQTGRLAMMVRSSMLEVRNARFMTMIELKGLPLHRRVFVHGLRNALMPVVTLAGWELVQGLAGYAVVVETVFAFPGIGYTAIQAIQHQDLVLLQAIVFVTAGLVVLINLVMDVIYRLIDPRIEVG